MKFLVVFACVVATAVAKPGFIAGYAAIVPGAPLGADGRVQDTPAVALAKAEHAAAHLNERLNLNREALRSADYVIAAPAAPIAPVAALPLAYSAPFAPATILATDPRPLDTPAVAYAKAAHAAAHAAETARNLGY